MRGFQSQSILYSERCAHICLAPSQNSIVWLPKHVMFEPILKIFSDGITVRVFAWTSPEETAVVYNTLLVVYVRELKIETFSGRRQLQPDVTSSFVGYCACSCSLPCRRGPVGDVKLACLALWRKREYLTFISIRFIAFSNQHFAYYRS